jgi:hypothetical protein
MRTFTQQVKFYNLFKMKNNFTEVMSKKDEEEFKLLLQEMTQKNTKIGN